MQKIAVDVGSGLTKWKTDTGQGCFPSAVGAHDFDEASFKVTDFTGDIVRIPDKAKPYLVGESADALLEESERHDTLSKDWAKTTEYQALLYKAISDAFPEGYEGAMALCIGLPQRYFEEQRAPVEKKLTGTHRFKVGSVDYSVQIYKKNFVVIPQSMSIFFHHVASEGEEALEDDVCVIDVGTFTSGYSMVNSGRFNHRKSGGLELGISNFRDDLKAFIKREHGLDLPASSVTRALVRGKIKVGSKYVKLASVIPAIADPLMDRLIEQLESQWGDASQTAEVLVGGGGARYVHKSLKRKWPHLKVVGGDEGCAMVIVEGYFGYLESC